jgi:hypothetical protein
VRAPLVMAAADLLAILLLHVCSYHTSAYVSIRQRTSAYACKELAILLLHVCSYVVAH